MHHQQEYSSLLLQELSLLNTTTSQEVLRHQNRRLLALLSLQQQAPFLIADHPQGGKQAGQLRSQRTAAASPRFNKLHCQPSQQSLESPESQRVGKGDSSSCSSSSALSSSSCRKAKPFVDSRSGSSHASGTRLGATGTTANTEATMWDQLPPRRTILFQLRDEMSMPPYQCLLRKQIELFEADQSDIEGITLLRRNQDRHGRQERKKNIIVGQVGIRCIHCGSHSMSTPGAAYFPSHRSMYRASKTLADRHLMNNCINIPESTRQELIRVHSQETMADSPPVRGCRVWESSLQGIGVVQDGERRLLYNDRLDIP